MLRTWRPSKSVPAVDSVNGVLRRRLGHLRFGRLVLGRGAAESALVVRVPEAEGAIERCRAAGGAVDDTGPHVTLLYPFVPPHALNAALLSSLEMVVGRCEPFVFDLVRIARFSDAVYLAPEPARPFLELTEAITRAWPRYPPYGGRFPEVIPHVTLVGGVDRGAKFAAEDVLGDLLPIRCRAAAVELLSREGGQWSTHARIALAGRSQR